MSRDDLLVLEEVSFTYEAARPPVRALEGLSFSVPAGSIVAVIGPSGCGKTTLLHILAGLKVPTSGRALVGGQEADRRREGTALIFQNYGLLPWKTVWENVALGLRIRRLARKEIRERVDDALELLGIDDERSRYPAQLSGGQRQRVAIARAIAIKPDLMLMDEPFSALDALTRERLQDAFLALWKKLRFTAVIVTHSIEEAAYLGHKVIVLSGKPGRIMAEVENPFFGLSELRLSEGFHRLSSELRELLRDAGEPEV